MGLRTLDDLRMKKFDLTLSPAQQVRARASISRAIWLNLGRLGLDTMMVSFVLVKERYSNSLLDLNERMPRSEASDIFEKIRPAGMVDLHH
jgi:hypothetical protein